MRNKVSIVALLLIAGFAATAAADTASPSPADLVFLKSLADSQGNLPEVGTPASQWKACSVSNECGDGNTVDCTGSWSCHTTIAGVKCDGHEEQCPNFCTISQSCDCCNGTYGSSCWSRRGDCQYTSDGIACDGYSFTCATACPLCQEW